MCAPPSIKSTWGSWRCSTKEQAMNDRVAPRYFDAAGTPAQPDTNHVDL